MSPCGYRSSFVQSRPEAVHSRSGSVTLGSVYVTFRLTAIVGEPLPVSLSEPVDNVYKRFYKRSYEISYKCDLKINEASPTQKAPTKPAAKVTIAPEAAPGLKLPRRWNRDSRAPRAYTRCRSPNVTFCWRAHQDLVGKRHLSGTDSLVSASLWTENGCLIRVRVGKCHL